MNSEVSKETALAGMFARRIRLVPTARGWLLLLLGVTLLCIVTSRRLYPFLAVHDLQSEGVLVVNGWAGEEKMREALLHAERGHFQHVLVIGGRPKQGGLLYAYPSAAEAGAALINSLSDGKVRAVAVPTNEWPENTKISAREVKSWMLAHGLPIEKVTIIADGPSARRTRLLYRKVFPSTCRVGVIPLRPDSYDPQVWWRSSAGVRTLVNELTVYVYDFLTA